MFSWWKKCSARYMDASDDAFFSSRYTNECCHRRVQWSCQVHRFGQERKKKNHLSQPPSLNRTRCWIQRKGSLGYFHWSYLLSILNFWCWNVCGVWKGQGHRVGEDWERKITRPSLLWPESRHGRYIVLTIIAIIVKTSKKIVLIFGFDKNIENRSFWLLALKKNIKNCSFWLLAIEKT